MAKQLKSREEMDKEYLWNLSEVYPSDEAWENEYTKTLAEMNKLSKYQGKLSEDSEILFKALDEAFSLDLIVSKLYVYAKLKFRQDMKNSLYMKFSSKADTIYANFHTIVSFFAPEIISIGEKKLNDFVTSVGSLQLYKQFFHNIFREAKHKLPPEQEELLAMLTEVSNTPTNVFSIINNTETHFEAAIDKDGNELEVTHGSYLKLLESKDRVLRENAYNSYFNYFTSRKETLAGLYDGYIKKEAFFAKARKHNSALEASLSTNSIPTEVYNTLIKSINNRLDLVHRYTNIRKKALNLDVVKPYDISVPIVDDIEYTIGYEEAKELILKSLAPMGAEYINIVKTILESGWVDVYENQNKMAGAFRWGSYGTPPYIMINYVDNLRSLFTLTHELGHSVHSHYTRTTQPYVYGSYTIFIAEIASTVHEALLIDYLLKTTEDKAMKKYLLSYQMNGFNSIFFRQTMFSEFEMEAHRLEESKTQINAESLSSIYKNLVEKYYGSDFETNQGIDSIIIDCVKDRLGIDEILTKIEKHNPDFIGINIFTQNFDIVKEIVEHYLGNAVIVIGGQVVKFTYEEILKWETNNELWTIIGESELILPDLIYGTYSEMPMYSKDNRKVYLVDKYTDYFPSCLDDIKIDRKLLKEEVLINHYGDKELAIVTSRGCPYNCSFCGAASSLNTNVTSRFRTPLNIEQEINDLLSTNNDITSIRILDDLFLRNNETIKNAINLFNKYDNISWRCMAQVLAFKESMDMLPLLKESGCRELFFGIETGSEAMRKKINKLGSVEYVERVITEVLEAGIDVKAYFMYGIYKESEQDAEMTFKLAYKLKEISNRSKGDFRVSVFQFRPYHGTPLYNEIVQDGKIIGKMRSSKSLNIIEGRSQFNFSSGNYSNIEDCVLENYIRKTQLLTKE